MVQVAEAFGYGLDGFTASSCYLTYLEDLQAQDLFAKAEFEGKHWKIVSKMCAET
jgi:hypothetical protein